MSEKITISDFKSGWVPSDNSVNGRPDGLLAMDNLELSQNGALTLAGGTSVIHTAPENCHSLYSKYLGSTKHIYYTGFSSGAVYRDNVSIISGGSTARTAIGAAFDYVFICSGNQRKKDTGTVVSDLGVTAPTVGVGVLPEAPDNIDVTKNLSNAVLINSEGTIVSSSSGQINLTTDADSLTGKIENVTGYPLDTTSYPSGNSSDGTDKFVFTFQCEDPAKLIGIRFELLLETPGSVGADVSEYYFLEVLNNSLDGPNQFNQGKNSWSVIQVNRSDFQRSGIDGVLAWQDVKGFRFAISGTEQIACALTSARFWGGTDAVLEGNYEWAQVNVSANGAFLSKSILGPTTGTINIPSSRVKITPQAPPVGANEVWIYRRSELLGEDFYLVKVLDATSGYGQFEDSATDTFAQRVNDTLNLNVKSIDFSSTPDQILALSGPFDGRMVYATATSLLISEANSPSTYDLRQVFKFAGTNAERFQWLIKITDNTLLVGTTEDVYKLSGTWNEFPDGTLDLFLRGMGVANPPIAEEATIYNKSVVYIAADGWRVLNASGISQLLTAPNVDRIYKEDAYGYSKVVLAPYQPFHFGVAIARNQLFVSMETANGSRRMDVFDFERNYWRPTFLNPSFLYTEENGNLIGFFGNDSKVRNLDVRTSKLLDGVTGQTFKALWTVRSGGDPNRRKDAFTVKFHGYSPSTIVLKVFLDESTTPLTVRTFTPGVYQQWIFDVGPNASVPIPVFKNIQIQLESAATSDFLMTSLTLDFENRPEQLTFLRIPPQTYGAFGRKHLPSIPFNVDTLNNVVTITPILDGVPATSLTFTTLNKTGKEYLFNSDSVFYQVEYYIQAVSGVFEWYGFETPRNLTVLPEPTKFLFLEPSNLGSAGVKFPGVFPFVFNPLGGIISVTPILDGVAGAVQNFSGTVKKTFKYFFSGESCVDLGWSISGSSIFEFYPEDTQRLTPKINEVFATATKSTLVGPFDFFRLGRVMAIEIVVIGETADPINVTLQFDTSAQQIAPAIFPVTGKEMSTILSFPKATEGQFLRIYLSSLSPFVFRKARVKVWTSGGGTDGQWTNWNAGN